MNILKYIRTTSKLHRLLKEKVIFSQLHEQRLKAFSISQILNSATHFQQKSIMIRLHVCDSGKWKTIQKVDDGKMHVRSFCCENI